MRAKPAAAAWTQDGRTIAGRTTTARGASERRGRGAPGEARRARRASGNGAQRRRPPRPSASRRARQSAHRGEVGVELGAQDRRGARPPGGRREAPRLSGSPCSSSLHATRPRASPRWRPRRRFASSRRARLMRLFTVPRGIPSSLAISSYGSPCRSHRMSGRRRSGGQGAQAAVDEVPALLPLEARDRVLLPRRRRLEEGRVLGRAAASPACAAGSGRWRGCGPRP